MDYNKLFTGSLFLALFGRVLISGSSWTQVAILSVIAGYSAFHEFHVQSKANKLVHTRLDEFDKHLTALYKGQEELKTRVTTAAVAQNLRPANFR